jgi:hypothetical protein
MARKRRASARKDPGFYGSFLVAESLAEASSIGGDADARDGGEIAEVRRRLIKALSRRPDDLRLLVQGANVLVRTAATEHALSPRAKNRLADSLAVTLRDLEEQLMPSDS